MKLEELQKLVDEAQAGPWSATHIYDGEEVIAGPQTSEQINYIATARDYRTARFIAAFSPETVGKLLDVVAAAEIRARQGHVGDCTKYSCYDDDCHCCTCGHVELIETLAALEK